MTLRQRGTLTLPAWMRSNDDVSSVLNELPETGRRPKNAYTDRVLLRVAVAFKRLLESGSSSEPGLMQSIGIGPRLAGTALVLLGAAVTGSLALLATTGLLILIAALLSSVRPVTLLYRVAPVLFFTALVTAPALLGLGTKEAGATGLLSYSFYGASVTVTSGALYAYASLLARVTVMLLSTSLLLLTTSRIALFGALRALPLLRGFATVLQMTYRHLLILLEEVQEAAMARKARTIGAQEGAGARAWFASRVGRVLVRSLATAEEVAQAMVSRGFNGPAPLWRQLRASGEGAGSRFAGVLWLLSTFFLFFIAVGT